MHTDYLVLLTKDYAASMHGTHGTHSRKILVVISEYALHKGVVLTGTWIIEATKDSHY
jgi:hypothetical protein